MSLDCVLVVSAAVKRVLVIVIVGEFFQPWSNS